MSVIKNTELLELSTLYIPLQSETSFCWGQTQTMICAMTRIIAFMRWCRLPSNDFPKKYKRKKKWHNCQDIKMKCFSSNL